MSFEQQPRQPWGGFQLLILIVLGGAAAWYLYEPFGLFVAGVFQRLIDAFQHHR